MMKTRGVAILERESLLAPSDSTARILCNRTTVWTDVDLQVYS